MRELSVLLFCLVLILPRWMTSFCSVSFGLFPYVFLWKGRKFLFLQFFFKGRPLASFLLVLFSSSLFCFCIKPACCQAGWEAVLCRCWGRQYLILTKMSQLRQPRANKHADSQALFWVCILSILPPTSAHLLPTGSLRGSCCWAHTFSKRMDGPDVVHTLRERITHS